MEDMDEARRVSISNALRRYQQVVEAHNRSTLDTIVDCLMSTPRPRMSDAAANQMHLVALKKFVRRPEISKVTELQQVLSMDLLLDGIDHKPVVSRQAWFATISTKLNLPKPNVPFPPPELEYLCSLTNSIDGPGLDWWQIVSQINLLSSNLEKPGSRVVIPGLGEGDRRFEYVCDYDITMGVQIGDQDSGAGGSYILYCQKDGIWAWRYAVHLEDWISDLYDTLEEYLDFYSHFREPTEQDTRNQARQWAKLI